MKLRSLLRILIPVCALGAVSCTNEELILDASQTQRGREFAQAFQARFGEVDPNHTWVDGSVGKVTVTTDEKANVVIYALGFNGNGLLKLKHTVVEGTAEVKYDIPMGAKDIVLRAYNNHGNEYKTLNPGNDNDEAVMTLASGTRSITSLNGVTAQPRSEIDNVWNIYGSVAPYQTDIPACLEAISTTKIDNVNGREVESRDWNFYYKIDGKKYNMFSNAWGQLFKNFVPYSYLGSENEFLTQTKLTASDKRTSSSSNGCWQLLKIEMKQEGSTSYYTASIVDEDGNVLEADIAKEQIYENKEIKEYSLSTKLSDGTAAFIPEGTYFNFKPYGKRGSWWIQQGQGFGHFYVTSMDLKRTNSGTLVNNNHYHVDLNPEICNYLVNSEKTGLLNQAEDEPDVLLEYNRDAGFTTLSKGPVSITYFEGVKSNTSSYIGYYYTTGQETDAKINAAPRYILMANCANGYDSGYRDGDTFPLTYYGEDGNGNPDFEFPENVNIHFFILHGRDSGQDGNAEAHPHSGHNNWTARGNGQWLFYDNVKSDGENENGWTLDAWYLAYSQGGVVNEAPINRLYDTGVHPDPYINILLEGNYKPTVAFNYAGYNIIGFEDTPVIEWKNGNHTSALDWNDCVFLLNGDFDIRSVEDEVEFAMCLEDLGGTDDLDYNDLYMTVKQPRTVLQSSGSVIYDAPKFTVHQVGGTLPLKVSFIDDEHNQDLFTEVHAAFGMPSDVAINTTDKAGSDEPVDVTFTSNGNDGVSPATIKCINGLGSRTTSLELSEEEAKTFSIIENASAITVTVTYDKSTNVEDEQAIIHVPTQEEQNEGTQKVPYAFIIPKILAQKDASGNEIENSEYETFTPPTERVYIGFKYSNFKNWVANQNAANDKWYYFHWGAANGADNSGWDAPSEGGSSQGGEIEFTAQDVISDPFGWSQPNSRAIKIPASFVSDATSLKFEFVFSATLTTNIKLCTLSGSNFDNDFYKLAEQNSATITSYTNLGNYKNGFCVFTDDTSLDKLTSLKITKQ